MMTFRRGWVGSAAGGQAMASYLLAGTLKPDTAKAAGYYLGQEATHQRARSFIIERPRPKTDANARLKSAPCFGNTRTQPAQLECQRIAADLTEQILRIVADRGLRTKWGKDPEAGRFGPLSRHWRPDGGTWRFVSLPPFKALTVAENLPS